MFTGIVETTGRIVENRASPSGRRLRVHAPTAAAQCRPGDSVCVNGVCLTVAEVHADGFDFDVIPETLQRTTLGQKTIGDSVNLERSLRAADRLDGHFVQGHVDGTAEVLCVESSGEYVVWLRPQADLQPFLIPKGSVAIDGVSLTIANSRDGDFSVALIPTTLERTTLGAVRERDSVNIETDILVRTIIHRIDQLGLVPSHVELESLVP